MKRWLTLILLLGACTDNSCSRTYGGTSTVHLPAGKKLMNATWKEKDLWYLTRPARPGETPEQVTFHESSNHGFLEGTVVFVEH